MPLQILVQPILTPPFAPERGLEVVITVWNRGDNFALLEEMSCSWHEAYRFDRPGIAFQGWACDNNVLRRRVLAPGEQVTHPKASLYFSVPQPREIVFRIGLIQPAHTISLAALGKAYRSTRYLPPTVEGLSRSGKERSQTCWSRPIRARARTAWKSR